MELHEAIRSAYGDMRQEDIAAAMGTRQQNVSNWATGRARVVPLDTIRRIEEVCGRPRGYILRAAGYAEPAITVEDAIDNDPFLEDSTRQRVKDFYRSQLKRD